MLHGMTFNWQSMQPLIDPLQANWQIYACDLRGHGKSGRSDIGQYRVPDYSRDIEALLTRQILEPAVLLGFSLGGWVAMQIAADIPQHVRALILLDPPLKQRQLPSSALAQHDWITWIRDAVQAAESVDTMAEQLAPIMPKLDAQARYRMADMFYRLDPAALTMFLDNRLSDSFDYDGVYQGIQCPTLLLWGEQTENDASVVRHEDVEYFRSQVPQVIDAQIMGVGHGLHWAQTDAVLEQIQTFLSPLRSDPG